MNKTLTITPPEGYEIDKEKSTFEQIVFKQVEEKKWDREARTKTDTYYYITRSREVGFTTDIGTWSNVIIAHTYPTKELAESEAHIFRTMQLMRNWARFHNELDGFVADWGKRSQQKHGIILGDEKVIIDDRSAYNIFIFGVTVSCNKRAQEMLEEFREDLLKIEW